MYVLSIKVGCENFSVYRQNTRTTSAVEAYNGVLGKSIDKNGNFFKFTKAIRKEEFFKSRHFAMLADGGCCTKKQRKKNSIEKDVRIKDATDLLDSGKITVATFLSRMVYQTNGICTDMVPPENIFEESLDVDEETSDDDGAGNNASTQSPRDKECVVCQDNLSNVVLLPCKHLKICNVCKLKLSGNSGQFLCPYCRQAVEDSLVVFV